MSALPAFPSLPDDPSEQNLLHSLPWSQEAETGLIGALLTHNDLIDQVADLLTPEHFHDQAIGRVFSAASQLINTGKQADIITVLNLLQEQSRAQGISLVWLNELTHAAGSARSVRRYAELIADKALARSFASAAGEVVDLAREHGPILDRIGMAQAKLETLQTTSTKSAPKAIQVFVAGMLDRIQAMADGKAEPGIPTRIPMLDRLLGGGIKPGRQMILAARPSVGKSSLAEQLCINIAKQGHACAMFSQEMTCNEMVDRATANLGRIDMGVLQTGRLGVDDWGRLAEATEQMVSLPIFFDEQPALTLPEIAAKARLLSRRHGIKLLVIDYIQLCGSSNPKASRHHQLEELSRGLKSLAKTLGITILTLSQLNREVEKRTSGRPAMSDLKESGAIEEDADVVMLMWRQQQGEHSHLIGLEVPKNRQGRTGEVALRFEGSTQRWGESTESLASHKKSHSYGVEL